MATTSSLNRVKYSGLDFQTIFDDLRAQLQIKFAADFNDFALSSLGIMLIDIIAFGLDTLSFYVDRRATDSYLVTARTRKAVARLTRQLGYKMTGAVSSSVDIVTAIQNPQAFSCPVNKGFQFKGPNNLIFEVAQSVTFSPGDGPSVFRTIPCYEGQTFVETFVSDGSANQVFELRKVPDQSFVVSGTVQVLVNGGPFAESDFLAFQTTNQFEVGYNDDPPTVRFGDGVAGNIPTASATIQVTYVASRGLSGQVGGGTIDDVVSPLVVNFTNIRLSVNNPQSSIGGDDLESLDHAKAFAGQVFKTRQVAVTRNDYETLAGAFADPLYGRVAVAQALSARSAASDLTLQNLLTIITTAVIGIKPNIDTQVAAGRAALDVVDAQVTEISSDLTTVAGLTTTISTQADDAISSARDTKNSVVEIGTEAAAIQGIVVDGKAAIDAVTTSVSSTLTASDKDSLKAYFDRINAQSTSIVSASSAIDTSAAAEISAMGTIKDSVVLIGTTTGSSGSQLLAIDTARQLVATESTTLRSVFSAITTLLVDETTTVSDATAAIDAHVDSILAADCQANLVTVPILAKNAGGFYAAPSLSLIQALQSFLDARKEVTQTVSVTSGANFLIPAVIVIRIGIRLGVSAQVMTTAVGAAVDGVLRARGFGVNLYVSDLTDAIREVDGVVFANVTIAGFLALDGVTVLSSNLDANGNLIISTSQVITKGTVTVNPPEVQT